MFSKISVFLISIFLTFQFANADESSFPSIDAKLLPHATVELLEKDFRAFGEIKLEVPSNDYFMQVFGGDREEDIMSYIHARIHYMGADIGDDPVEKQSTYALNEAPNFLTYYYHHEILKEADAVPTTDPFEDQKIETTSPRTGFVAVGDAYTDPATTRIDRLDTLIHEARHSDCAEIPSKEDLADFDKENYINISEKGRACTHMHMPCPKGHPLAGDLSCDGHDWGAYTMGYVFSKAVNRFCINCTEKEKQEALATATDDFSRLFKHVQKNLLSGTGPTPNMESLP